jgi:nitroimidazol reductase NimA-like FMN-containing flavoprotein (pyridoxamine 5'-phosphate oxidase superfamily)
MQRSRASPLEKEPRVKPAAGPWSPAEIEAHLRTTVVPVRLACVSRSGQPRVLSLWYLWREGALWCATSPRARVVRWLAREPRCAFEVAPDAPPYRGVRGQGRATLDPARGGEILAALVDRYLATRETPFARWLLARAGDEMAIRIEPARLASWDFTRRMGGR